MRFQICLAVIVSICFSGSNAQSIGAFYSSSGPSVVTIDSTAGKLYYSVFARNGYSALTSLPLVYKPLQNTSLAVVGYTTGSNIISSTFYQTHDNFICQQMLICAYATGICDNFLEGPFLLSDSVTVPVKPGTSLAVSLFSRNIGYRVSYQDINGSIRQLSYSNNTANYVTDWADGMPTTNITVTNGAALSTIHYTGNGNGSVPSNQTIFQSSNGQILQFNDRNVTSANTTDIWTSGSSIGNLTNWDTNNGTFSVIRYNNWRALFYIDTTSKLQYLRSIDDGLWQTQPQMDTSVWPLADSPSAPLSATASINTTDNSASVFYVSGGKMIQVIMYKGNWQNYVVVDGPILNITSTNNIIPQSQPTITHDTNPVKLGASLGAVMAFIIMFAIIAYFVQQKRLVQPSITSEGDVAKLTGVSDSDFSVNFNVKAELHSDSTQIYELDHDPECLLLHQLMTYRVYEAKGEIPTELQTIEGKRSALDHTLCKCELDAAVLCELPTSCEKEEVEDVSEGPSNCQGKGKEKASHMEVQEVKDSGSYSLKGAVVQLPMWSWAILKREAEEMGKNELDLEKGEGMSENGKELETSG